MPSHTENLSIFPDYLRFEQAIFRIERAFIPMWRDRLNEIKKEKGISTKEISEKSGLSIDTITRILNSKDERSESSRINTIADLCDALGVEVWEIFYTGGTSLVLMQAEIELLKNERDNLIAENGALKDKVETLRDKFDSLKDEIIATHNYYIKNNSKE